MSAKPPTIDQLQVDIGERLAGMGLDMRALWQELEDALAGTNGYGGDVAEIYAYRLVKSYGRPPMSEAQSREAGWNLTLLLRRFREVHSDAVVLLDTPRGFVPLGEDGECPPFNHRAHVRVERITQPDKAGTTGGHVAMETFPSGHRNLTTDELDALLAHYSSDEHERQSGGGWMTRAAVAELKSRRAQNRDSRQEQVMAWAKAAFGEAQATGLAQRGLRLLEEAVEAFQAAGGDKAQGHKLIDYVFDRKPGELGQELGGVGVCVLALAAAAGLSADEEERREVARVLAKPVAEFAARNQAKNDAGFLAADAGGAPDAERLITAEEAATFVEGDPRPRHWTPRGWAWGPRLTPPGVDWEAVPQVSSDDHQRLVAMLRAAEIGTNHDGTVLGMVRELVRQRDLSQQQRGELVEAYAKLATTPPATDAEIGAGIKNNMLANELARIRLAVNRAAVPTHGADDVVSLVEAVVDALINKRADLGEWFDRLKDAAGSVAAGAVSFDQLAVVIAKQRDELALARKRLDTAHRGLAETWADEHGSKQCLGVPTGGANHPPTEAPTPTIDGIAPCQRCGGRISGYSTGGIATEETIQAAFERHQAECPGSPVKKAP